MEVDEKMKVYGHLFEYGRCDKCTGVEWCTRVYTLFKNLV